MLTLNKHTGVVTYFHETFILTRYEMALLLFLFEHLGQAVSRNAIMAKMYGGKDEPDIKVIEVMIHRIRTKLKICDITIHTVWGFGYRMTINAPIRVKVLGGIE